MPKPVALVNYAFKFLLVAALVYCAVNVNDPRFADKAPIARLLTYPISALLVPLVWFLTGRRRSYPHLIDALIVMPFMIDTLGNVFNLFDTIVWFDDFLHFLNWVPWVLSFGLLLRYWDLGRLNVAALTVGYGAVTHILWEIGEYYAFIRYNVNELPTAYSDTLGDLALSLTGSFLGGILVGTVLWGIGTPDDVGSQAVSSG